MAVTTTAWTNPRNGETRHYITDDYKLDIIGVVAERNIYGDITTIILDGGKTAPKNMIPYILKVKVWAEDNGTIHVDNFWAGDLLTEEQALANAIENIALEGGLDFLTTEETEEAKEINFTEAAEIIESYKGQELEEAEEHQAGNLTLTVKQVVDNSFIIYIKAPDLDEPFKSTINLDFRDLDGIKKVLADNYDFWSKS